VSSALAFSGGFRRMKHQSSTTSGRHQLVISIDALRFVLLAYPHRSIGTTSPHPRRRLLHEWPGDFRGVVAAAAVATPIVSSACEATLVRGSRASDAVYSGQEVLYRRDHSR
jgi:hypothetical protein